jgi:hypothetical protein
MFGSAPGDLIGLRLGTAPCEIRTYVAADKAICLSGKASAPSLVKPQVLESLFYYYFK